MKVKAKQRKDNAEILFSELKHVLLYIRTERSHFI